VFRYHARPVAQRNFPVRVLLHRRVERATAHQHTGGTCKQALDVAAPSPDFNSEFEILVHHR
jgi:hypothetical protein